jgi:4-hydroxyproline epimerase
MRRRVDVVDSHTGGEPTRVVVAGGPDLGGGSMRERLERFARDHDRFRSAVVNEPRGSDVLVGALLVEPAGVIFFNNVGTIGMCGHGMMGVVVTLAHLKRPVPARIETAVGAVDVEALGGGRVRIANVASRRTMKDVKLEVPGHGPLTGDVAWGGNWFFLAELPELGPADRMTALAWAVRRELARRKITGEGGGEIDHVELFGPSTKADRRNFVLCPGGAYDRSPCGTGTSAKVACLIADGKLREGQVWRQESYIGSVFEATARIVDGQVWPTIEGSSHVTAEATLILDPEDPFVDGIRA